MVRPAKYNELITVQTREKDENEIGGWSNDWSDWFSTKASVEPLEGRDRLEYGKAGFLEAYRVEMRSRIQNVTGECRILHDSNPYQISELTIRKRERKVNLIIAR